MSNLPSRRQREARAFQLVTVGGVSATVAVVGFALALITSFPGSIAVLAALVAVVCLFLFKKQTGS